MKKFYVRKILKYDPTFGGKFSRYVGYRLIGLKKKDPKILGAIINQSLVGFGGIFHSTQKRGLETARAFSRSQNVGDLVALKELEEITFDLGKLLSEKEFDNLGSSLVRKRITEAFIADELKESREEIKKRLDRLLSKLARIGDGNFLIISHSFFMKILQTYFLDQHLFNNPEVLRKHFDHTKKTFKFGCGFEFSL